MGAYLPWCERTPIHIVMGPWPVHSISFIIAYACQLAMKKLGVFTLRMVGWCPLSCISMLAKLN